MVTGCTSSVVTGGTWSIWGEATHLRSEQPGEYLASKHRNMRTVISERVDFAATPKGYRTFLESAQLLLSMRRGIISIVVEVRNHAQTLCIT